MTGLLHSNNVVKTVVVITVLVTCVSCLSPPRKYGSYLDRKLDRVCRQIKCTYRRLNCRSFTNRPPQCEQIKAKIGIYGCSFIDCSSYGSVSNTADCAQVAPAHLTEDEYEVRDADNCALEEHCFVQRPPPTTTTVSTTTLSTTTEFVDNTTKAMTNGSTSGTTITTDASSAETTLLTTTTTTEATTASSSSPASTTGASTTVTSTTPIE